MLDEQNQTNLKTIVLSLFVVHKVTASGPKKRFIQNIASLFQIIKYFEKFLYNYIF